jgi:hypothetical protein
LSLCHLWLPGSNSPDGVLVIAADSSKWQPCALLRQLDSVQSEYWTYFEIANLHQVVVGRWAGVQDDEHASLIPIISTRGGEGGEAGRSRRLEKNRGGGRIVDSVEVSVLRYIANSRLGIYVLLPLGSRIQLVGPHLALGPTGSFTLVHRR